MYKGSCLCGHVRYEIQCEPEKVSHCHCTMCQKQHGAAFATYVSFPKRSLVYTQGVESLSSYNSSGTIIRKFCSNCGSNIEWCGSTDYPHCTSIALATFDTPYQTEAIQEIYQETAVCWLKRE